MANSVPTLTNENFHMFEPSPIETSLAANVDNPMTPSARGNLFRYQTGNALQGQQYQEQVNQMHAAQIAEAIMAQRTARMTGAATALKDAGQTPGMADVLQRMGLVDPGIDLSPIGNAANAASSAKNMGEAGRGIGSAAMGGITGLAPAAQSVFGPGVGQGPAAIVQAAGVKEAGANSRAGGAGGLASVSMPVGPPGPNQATVRMKVHPSMIPGLPPFLANSGGNLPTASVDGSDGGDDGVANNPLLGNIPGTVPPPAIGSSTDAATTIRNDIATSKVPPKQQPDGSTLYTGASGKTYIKRGS